MGEGGGGGGGGGGVAAGTTRGVRIFGRLLGGSEINNPWSRGSKFF